jgi:hypothetical protein
MESFILELEKKFEINVDQCTEDYCTRFTFPLALQYVVLRLRCAAFLLEVGSADLAERGASN